MGQFLDAWLMCGVLSNKNLSVPSLRVWSAAIDEVVWEIVSHVWCWGTKRLIRVWSYGCRKAISLDLWRLLIWLWMLKCCVILTKDSDSQLMWDRECISCCAIFSSKMVTTRSLALPSQASKDHCPAQLGLIIPHLCHQFFTPFETPV